MYQRAIPNHALVPNEVDYRVIQWGEHYDEAKSLALRAFLLSRAAAASSTSCTSCWSRFFRSKK